MYQVLLAAAQAALVGDVVDVVVGLGVLAVSAADLDVEAVRDGLELGLLGAEKGQMDVNRGTEGGAEVGGA